MERAIQLLHDEEHLLQDSKEAIHELIGEGLAQLDRGEGVTGEISRTRLAEKKAKEQQAFNLPTWQISLILEL